MTIEEKRKSIKKHCDNTTCERCVLKEKSNCYGAASDEEVEENYRLIRGQQGNETQTNAVDHPEHYKHGLFETIEEMLLLFSKEEVIAFCKINAYKYKARAPFKGNMDEDLKKADWYLAKVKELEGK